MLMQSDAGEVRISMVVRAIKDSKLRGISSVTLRSEQPRATFHVSLDPETRYLRGSAELPGARIAERIIRAALGNEEQWMASELAILGHDRIYEEAIQTIAPVL